MFRSNSSPTNKNLGWSVIESFAGDKKRRDSKIENRSGKGIKHLWKLKKKTGNQHSFLFPQCFKGRQNSWQRGNVTEKEVPPRLQNSAVGAIRKHS